MEVRYDLWLVTLSVLVAIFASYVALNLAHSVFAANGRARAVWLSCGALAMGIGIWSMHFVGMLAFEMPGMEMAYDIPLMALSVVIAVFASTLALIIVSRPVVPTMFIIWGGIAMAIGIAGMHYTGMYSMRMAASIRWDYYLVVLSVLIALGASFAALAILIRLRTRSDQFLPMILAATVMGFAIAGMHYTGMFAATFVDGNDLAMGDQNLMVTSGLTLFVIATTLLILGVALVGSIGQRILTARQRRAQEVLNKSEERFRALVDAVKDYAIFMLNGDGHITTWNRGAERILGYRADQVIGKPMHILYPEQALKEHVLREELRKAAATGHFEAETLRVRKDGTTFWANIVLSPLLNADGRVTGFSKVIRDITALRDADLRLRKMNEDLEKRVAERTLEIRKRETQLRMITNALPVLIGQLDLEERFLFVNEALANWFNRSIEQMIGASFREVLGEDRYSLNEPYIRRALAGQPTTYERSSYSGNRQSVLNITFVPEFDGAGAVTGFLLMATNVAKYKEIEAELKNAKRMVEAASEAKSAFLANMSHEIRTPLGAVLGFSELLATQDITQEEKMNSVEIIKRNGHLLSNIINDILDLSKVEAGKLEVERVQVPFLEVMAELNSMLNLEAAEKGIRLTVMTEGTLPSHIMTDSLRLRQVLVNIVGNAIKFTEKGAVDVTVKIIPATNDRGAKLAFIVKDTGPGIAPGQAAKLFTPFTQADPTTTRKYGGTGLGLVLSKRLANALGGDVVLMQSQRGIGSTFVITIDPGPLAATILPKPKPAATLPVNLRESRILIVDDSVDNQELIERYLTLAGAQVETADNGREGLQKAIGGDFSVVLMDLQMPEMDGHEATRELRARGYTKPIIALTAHAMKEERQRCLESGFDEHLTKPIDRATLLQSIAAFEARA